jgi:hypothetical protein
VETAIKKVENKLKAVVKMINDAMESASYARENPKLVEYLMCAIEQEEHVDRNANSGQKNI